MLLPTELEGRTHLITLIRLLLSDYYYPGSDWNPHPKIRPVVNDKQLSGSQIRISIRITPNFELGLPMIITSLLTKFHQNPTSRFWEILLTNKQTNRHTKVIAISRFSRDKKMHCKRIGHHLFFTIRQLIIKIHVPPKRAERTIYSKSDIGQVLILRHTVTETFWDCHLK